MRACVAASPPPRSRSRCSLSLSVSPSFPTSFFFPILQSLFLSAALFLLCRCSGGGGGEGGEQQDPGSSFRSFFVRWMCPFSSSVFPSFLSLRARLKAKALSYPLLPTPTS